MDRLSVVLDRVWHIRCGLLGRQGVLEAALGTDYRAARYYAVLAFCVMLFKAVTCSIS